MYLTYIDCSVFMYIKGVCLYVWWGGGVDQTVTLYIQ